MAKKTIDSYEDYMNIVINLAYNPRDFTKDQANEMAESRYTTGSSYSYRMRDFANENLIGKGSNDTDLFNYMNRLDDIIKVETDPVKKAMAMAVRRVTYPLIDDIKESQLFTHLETYGKGITEDKYNITKKAKEEYKAKKSHLYATLFGTADAANHKEIDPNAPSQTPEYDKRASAEKVYVLTALINSFFDRNICRDNNGKVFKEDEAMKDILALVNKEAVEITKSLADLNASSVMGKDDSEKKDFEDLQALCNGMTDAQKQNFANEINGFNSLQKFADMDITPKPPHLNLELEKNIVIDLSAREFIQKEKLKDTENGLSYSEIEWGESNIDYMLQRLYTDDELKGLKRAGIDPAEGILVDGKPLDWHTTDKQGHVKNLSLLDSARKKCEIVAKALSGSKIDVCKFVPDGKGGFTTGDMVPVKTDLAMKTKRRSLLQWLKELFGFQPTIEESIQKANEEPRDYQKYTANTEHISPLKKNAVISMVNNALDTETKLLEELDRKFFGNAFPEIKEYNLGKVDAAVPKAVSFTNYNGDPSQTLKALDRLGSRVDIAILYGMTQGYTLDEMLFSKDIDRGKIGMKFIEEFGTMDYDEFAKSKNLEQNDETRKQYNSYLYGKMENVENFCARAYEQLGKLEIPHIDPNNHLEYANNFIKLSRIGNLACDFAQAFPTLNVDKISPSNKDKTKAFERASALGNKTYFDVKSLQFIGGVAKVYANYLVSDKYANVPDNIEGLSIPEKQEIDLAARAKGFLSYFNKITSEKNTFSEIIKDKELNAALAAISAAAATRESKVIDGVTRNNALFYLQTENPEHGLFYINTDQKSIVNSGHTIAYGNLYDDNLKDINTFTKEYEDKIHVADKEKMSLSQAHEAQIKLDNVEKKPPEKVDYKTFVGADKTQKTTAPKVNTAEKAVQKTAQISAPTKK